MFICKTNVFTQTAATNSVQRILRSSSLYAYGNETENKRHKRGDHVFRQDESSTTSSHLQQTTQTLFKIHHLPFDARLTCKQLGALAHKLSPAHILVRAGSAEEVFTDCGHGSNNINSIHAHNQESKSVSGIKRKRLHSPKNSEGDSALKHRPESSVKLAEDEIGNSECELHTFSTGVCINVALRETFMGRHACKGPQ